jgi:hypothetical protein
MPLKQIFIYVALLNEGTQTWRPVPAIYISGNIFLLTSSAQEQEEWQFASGTLVHCENRTFSDGEKGLVAVRKEISFSESNPPSSNYLIKTAQQYADEIVRGTITPYQGGRRIWWECQLKLDKEDHRLDPFAYWAIEYEETQDHERRELCDKAIVEAAKLLIQSGSAL